MKLRAKKDIYDAIGRNLIIFYKGKIYETRKSDSGDILLKTELGHEEYMAICNKDMEIESLLDTEEFEIVSFD
jgi:hypothetical protein